MVIMVNSDVASSVICITVLLLLAGCSSDAPPSVQPSYDNIRWSDGDSGYIDDLAFRLRNVDAPETGGALCEQERLNGLLAKVYMEQLTQSATLVITANYGLDRYDRSVVDLMADDLDVAASGIEAGHIRSWPHDDFGNSLSSKPDWCA